MNDYISVLEMRRRILQYLIPGKEYFICTIEQITKDFKRYGKIFEVGFHSLLKDNFVIIPYDRPDVCAVNLQKISAIDEEFFTSHKVNEEIVQQFDKNFSNLSPVFESETDRNLPNKGKYYHFTKKDDPLFWISVVKTKGSSKSNKLVLGSLRNSKSRLYRIYTAILKITKNSGKESFIKKNIEDEEPNACGNTRQYSRAALDILEHLGYIRGIRSKGRSTIYVVLIIHDIFLVETNREKEKGAPRQLTFDEINKNVESETMNTNNENHRYKKPK